MGKNVHFALLYSHIEYCIINLGCAATSVLDPLIKLQMRMLRIMAFSYIKASLMPLLHKSHLLTLNDVFKLQIPLLITQTGNN